MDKPSKTFLVRIRPFVTCLLRFEVTVCIFLEAILFFGLFTDYSWKNILANLFFPLVVGFICLLVYISTLIIKPRKWLLGLWLWPGMIYGLLQLALLVLLILPPFWLADIFLLGEELERSTVQQAVSPDGTKTALVSYKPSGAYTSGLGSVEVRLTYKNLPFIKRDLPGIGKTNSEESRTDWVEWDGNSNLYYVGCGHESIDIGSVQFQMPFILMLFRDLFHLVTGL